MVQHSSDKIKGCAVESPAQSFTPLLTSQQCGMVPLAREYLKMELRTLPLASLLWCVLSGHIFHWEEKIQGAVGRVGLPDSAGGLDQSDLLTVD